VLKDSGKVGSANPILVNLNLDLNGMLKVTGERKRGKGLQKDSYIDTRGTGRLTSSKSQKNTSSHWSKSRPKT